MIRTAKHDFIENRKGILLGLGSIVGTMMLWGAVLGLLGLGGGDMEVVSCWFLGCVLACVGASQAFSSMKDKTGRIATLMLPATAFQKFFVRWVAMVPVLFAVILGSIYLCDLMRIFVHWLTDGQYVNGEHYMSVFNPFKLKRLWSGEVGPVMAVGATSWFMTQSFYLFGSILWPRLSFFKTMVALWAIQTVVGILLTVLDGFLPDFRLMGADWETVKMTMYGWSVVCAAVTVGMYWLTYWKFERSQVV